MKSRNDQSAASEEGRRAGLERQVRPDAAVVGGKERTRGVVQRLLLEKGAELDSNDKYGRTPLSWAVKILINNLYLFLISKFFLVFAFLQRL
jgi:hypothetical protein